MQNPRLASRYAKSLLVLAEEQNVLEATLEDMKTIHAVSETSKEFTLMLRSPVIKGDKKFAVLKAILGDKIQPLSLAFVELLIRKGREFFLPEMAQAYVKQYKQLKHIHTVKLKTAIQLDEELKAAIHKKITTSINDGTIELQTIVDEDLIGGFVIETGDKQFDASIRRDLNDIKMQFSKNLYIAEI